jgi:hypothetical protein
MGIAGDIVMALASPDNGPMQAAILLRAKPSTPIHTVHVDCLGPLPASSDKFKHILVLVDAFTKRCNLIPLKTVKTHETQQALQNFISSFGTPKVMIMDGGTNFHNLPVCKFLGEWNIQYHFIIPDVHRANGQVERTIMNLIRIETEVRKEWPSALWKIQLVLNTTVQKSIKLTPLQALIGIDATTPLIQAALNDLSHDLTPVRNLELDRRRMAERLRPNPETCEGLNKKRRDTVHYSVGDFVLLHRSSKLHTSKSAFELMGPYEVMNITDKGRYELKRVGPAKKHFIKAAKEQLRWWPVDWSLATEMTDLLTFLELEDDTEGNATNVNTQYNLN